MPEMRRLPCPFPFPKEQPVQAQVRGNLSTVYRLKSVQIALKAVGKMSLPPLGTLLSLNTSLTLRLRAAFWKICELLQICLELLHNSDYQVNYVVLCYSLEITKFIKGRKKIFRPCSPFHFSDTQAVIFVFCNCLVSPLLLLMF